MPEDKDVIYNKQSQEVDDTEGFSPTELASDKAVHDGNVVDELNSVDHAEKEATEEDFEKFDINAVDDLEKSKDEK